MLRGRRRAASSACPPELPAALCLHHHPLGDPVLDHVDEEQRIAPCPGVELVHQTARKPMARQRAGHVPADARFAERCEWQLHAESVNGQLVLCGHDHVLVPGGVRRPVRPEHQQPSGRSAAGQERQQLHGGGVAPVEVLENHDHGLLLREGFGRLGHLSHHSLTGGALSPERQGLEGCGVEEARNLGQPAGRVLFENLLQPDPAGSSREMVESREHGQVRLARPEMLDALALSDPATASAGHLSQKRRDQRRFADARLSGQEDQLAISSECLLQARTESADLRLAPDEASAGRAALIGIVGIDRGVTEARDLRARTGCGRWADGGQKSIAPAMDGLDEAWRQAVIAERSPQLADPDLEHRVPDHRVGPDSLEQGHLRHELPRARQEATQESERFGGERNRLRPAPQPLVTQVDPEVPEPEGGLSRPCFLREISELPLDSSSRHLLRFSQMSTSDDRAGDSSRSTARRQSVTRLAG